VIPDKKVIPLPDRPAGDTAPSLCKVYKACDCPFFCTCAAGSALGPVSAGDLACAPCAAATTDEAAVPAPSSEPDAAPTPDSATARAPKVFCQWDVVDSVSDSTDAPPVVPTRRWPLHAEPPSGKSGHDLGFGGTSGASATAVQVPGGTVTLGEVAAAAKARRWRASMWSRQAESVLSRLCPSCLLCL
jgi:hypothetical protein